MFYIAAIFHNRQLVVLTYELIYIVRAAHCKGKNNCEIGLLGVQQFLNPHTPATSTRPSTSSSPCHTPGQSLWTDVTQPPTDINITTTIIIIISSSSSSSIATSLFIVIVSGSSTIIINIIHFEFHIRYIGTLVLNKSNPRVGGWWGVGKLTYEKWTFVFWKRIEYIWVALVNHNQGIRYVQ